MVSINKGDVQQFNATGKDQYGNTATITNPVWTTSGGGTLNPSGSTCTYTATTAGSYTITCTENGTTIKGTATITVNEPPRLVSIEVSPPAITMNVGDKQLFTATGKDQNGATTTITNPVWSTSGGGTLNPSGSTCTYTATTAGRYTITCTENGTTIKGTARVQVAPPGNETDIVVVTPDNVVFNQGQTQQFEAKGYGPQGNEASIAFGRVAAEIPITPTWSATGGPITQDGLYTAGSLPGRYQVTAEATVGNSTATGFARVEITGTATCPDLDPDQSWIHTFTTAGVYPYYDRYNPNLRGTVVVSPTRSTLGMLNAATVISITAAGFDPFSVTIGVSDTVRWSNTDIITHAIRGGVPYNHVYLPLVVRQ